VYLHSGFLVRFVVGIQLAGDIPQVLTSVIQIDDLNRAGEVLIGEVPDPFGAVADDDFPFRAVPSAIPGLTTGTGAQSVLSGIS
jgi:hypothetical protein